jgi:hypothetical protein
MAINDYSKAIELDKSHFKAYYNRTFCYEQLNLLDKAVDDYE